MNISNDDFEYVERVQSAMDAMHCPTCGAKASLMAFGWSPSMGSFVIAPVFSCDTPGCEFNTTSQSAWTPVSIP